MIEFFEQCFGPYPLDRYGIAITDSFGGLAMETQERSMFGRDDFLRPSSATSTRCWPTSWRTSGSATRCRRTVAGHLAQRVVRHLRRMDVGRPRRHRRHCRHRGRAALRFRSPGSPADPGVEDMFGCNSYDGGAVVLHALRLTIGDDAFFELLRRWVADNNGTSRGTGEFIALAEEVAGRSLADVLRHMVVRRPCATESGFAEVSRGPSRRFIDGFAPLRAVPVRVLVAVGADRQHGRVDTDEPQRLGLPLARRWPTHGSVVRSLSARR